MRQFSLHSVHLFSCLVVKRHVTLVVHAAKYTNAFNSRALLLAKRTIPPDTFAAMETITIVNTGDPSDTRTVAKSSWKHWPLAKGMDKDIYRSGPGAKIYQVVNPEAKQVTAAPRHPIAPREIAKPAELVAKPAELESPIKPAAVPEPEPTKEVEAPEQVKAAKEAPKAKRGRPTKSK
jgi:hypothetical protein